MTSLRGVNRTDAFTLGSRFGTLADILKGSKEQYSACPGVGPVKGQRLWDAFNEPFKKTLGSEGIAGGSQHEQQHQQQQGETGGGQHGSLQGGVDQDDVEDIEDVEDSLDLNVSVGDGGEVDGIAANAGGGLPAGAGVASSGQIDVVPASDDEGEEDVMPAADGDGDVLDEPGVNTTGQGLQEGDGLLQQEALLFLPMEDEFLEEDDYEEF